MVSTFTANKSLEKPATGDQVGTWGSVTVNPNMDKIDNSFGGVATVALTNAPVTLSSGQYVNAFIRFTGAITANIAVTFPAVGSFYTIINDTTNSSAFIITALTTAAGGRTIGLPPGTMTQVMSDITNMRFSQLPPVGSYWDYAGSSVPAWISACTIPPFLNCDGTSFSSGTYPALTALLGGTTLPDCRGRMRMALDAGVGRVSSGVSGVAGNTIFSGGGDQRLQQHSHSATATSSVTDPGHDHAWNAETSRSLPTAAGGGQSWTGSSSDVTSVEVTGITVNTSVVISNFGSGSAQNMPPVLVHGLTLIRSA